jgi:hypothetical protein
MGVGGGVVRTGQVLPVVCLPFWRIAEDSVGVGNADEAFGGGGVAGVSVWVMGLGERVEGPEGKSVSLLPKDISGLGVGKH